MSEHHGHAAIPAASGPEAARQHVLRVPRCQPQPIRAQHRCVRAMQRGCKCRLASRQPPPTCECTGTGTCHLAGTLLGRFRIQQPELEIEDWELQLVVSAAPPRPKPSTCEPISDQPPCTPVLSLVPCVHTTASGRPVPRPRPRPVQPRIRQRVHPAGKVRAGRWCLVQRRSAGLQGSRC